MFGFLSDAAADDLPGVDACANNGRVEMPSSSSACARTEQRQFARSRHVTQQNSQGNACDYWNGGPFQHGNSPLKYYSADFISQFDFTQRNPTCSEPVSGGVPRRAVGR